MPTYAEQKPLSTLFLLLIRLMFSTEIKVIESVFCEADIGLRCIEVTKLMLSTKGLYYQILATTAILFLNW